MRSLVVKTSQSLIACMEDETILVFDKAYLFPKLYYAVLVSRNIVFIILKGQFYFAIYIKVIEN